MKGVSLPPLLKRGAKRSEEEIDRLKTQLFGEIDLPISTLLFAFCK
jgi:hypothetical protein